MDRTARRFEGVIFDVGDILYDASLWRRWLTQALQDEGIAITYAELVDRWEALLVDVYRGRADYWDRFEALLRSTNISNGRIQELVTAARDKGQEVQRHRSAMPGVPSTLRTLKNHGIRLSALSDTESGEGTVRAILRQLEIEEMFDAVVASVDIGVVKPNPRAYAAAAGAMALEVGECAFVGHDIDELEGATRAGLFAVAYNYHPDAPADVFLDHFSDLTDVVLGEVEEA